MIGITAAAALLIGGSAAMLGQPEINYVDAPAYTTTTLVEDWVESNPPVLTTTTTTTTTTTAKPLAKTTTTTGQKVASTSTNAVTTSVPEAVTGSNQYDPSCMGGWKEITNLEEKRTRAHWCWDGLIAQYPWPQQRMFGIMFCESKGDPLADNPNSSANGLMQILGGSKDPVHNMLNAYGMWQKSGTGPWSECGG